MTGMSLSELVGALPRARWLSPGNPRVERVVCDSRLVRSGDLFVAVSGSVADGHRFVDEAVRAGAVAVAVERAESAPAGIPAVEVPDGREAVALLAHFMAGDPTRHLTVCGVTGTNGKTTSTYMLRSILEAVGHRVGLLGTVSYQFGGKTIAAATTTPGPAELAEYFAEMVASGVDAAVMEVSSHALDQRRTLGVRFRVAAFTNLTAEHLDYHKDMASYREAKGRLFAGLDPESVAVLNRDDETSGVFARATRARILWYGMGEGTDVRATEVKTSIAGSGFLLHLREERRRVRLRLLGRHNVYNAMTAAGMAVALEIPAEAIVSGLESLGAVPGRLEPVACGQPFGVLVDFAHTDDALENSLSAVKPLTTGRLIVVFGCGGDRDRAKRPRMAAVAEKWGDVVIVTSDNPRTEVPEAIADEVFRGFRSPAMVVRDVDRASAIRRAVETAEDGDVIVIAGKGHETYQIVGTSRRHFDDREEAEKALAARGYCASKEGCPCK